MTCINQSYQYTCLFLQVICTAHSKLSFDGKPLPKDGKEFMAVIAKDGKQKGFFLRLVDIEVSLDIIPGYVTVNDITHIYRRKGSLVRRKLVKVFNMTYQETWS